MNVYVFKICDGLAFSYLGMGLGSFEFSMTPSFFHVRLAIYWNSSSEKPSFVYIYCDGEATILYCYYVFHVLRNLWVDCVVIFLVSCFSN